jgi:hypothetical protein
MHGSLLDVLTKQGAVRDERLLAHIARQVLLALAYLHGGCGSGGVAVEFDGGSNGAKMS